MQRLILTICMCCALPIASNAQSPNREDADRLLDYAEANFPDLLAPPATTGQTEAYGSTWYYRDYGFLAPSPGSTGMAMAINISGGGDFNAGDVLAVGGPYGSEPAFIDTLSNLLLTVPDASPSAPVSEIVSPGNGNCIETTPISSSVLRRYQENIGSSTTIISERRFPIYHNPGITFIGKEEIQENGRVIQSYDTEPYVLATIADGLQYLQEERIEYTELSPNPGNQFTVTTAYEGGLFQGPAHTFCEEQSWYIAPTTKTVTTTPASNPPGDSAELIPATTVTVNSVSEYITPPLELTESNYTPPLRTFRTTAVSEEGTTVRWYIRDRGVLVKEEVYDANGALVSSKNIISLYISNQ